MEIRKYNANILKQGRLRTRHLNPMFIGTITTTVQNPNILKIELHTSHNLITQHNVLYLIPVERGGGWIATTYTIFDTNSNFLFFFCNAMSWTLDISNHQVCIQSWELWNGGYQDQCLILSFS